VKRRARELGIPFVKIATKRSSNKKRRCRPEWLPDFHLFKTIQNTAVDNFTVVRAAPAFFGQGEKAGAFGSQGAAQEWRHRLKSGTALPRSYRVATFHFFHILTVSQSLLGRVGNANQSSAEGRQLYTGKSSG
jgi:hypothetical protein